jgi:adenylate cyclase
MGQEIERKFLVRGQGWRGLAPGLVYAQGYLNTSAGCTVRVRVVGEQGYLTIKGPTQGYTRLEFEYPIPVLEAHEILQNLSQTPVVEKTRYKIPFAGLLWEVDEFAGANQGLVIAEVELTHPEQPVLLPDWVGAEVTADPRYANSNLARYPYSQWGSQNNQ